MVIQPIDAGWAQRVFPTVFELYGAALWRQIEQFNSVVADGRYSWDDVRLVFDRMERERVRPHRPILNSLSMLQVREDVWPRAVAPLFLLESHLADSLAAGDDRSTFKSMLIPSSSYLNLIAEIDWISQLRKMGAVLAPHSATREGEEGNFDVNAALKGQRILGDVKWFKNWLVKERGEDLLSAHIQLIRPDLTHDIIISAKVREMSVDLAIRGAVQTVAMYEAAMNPGAAAGRFVVDAGIEEIAVFCRDPASIIEYVRVLTKRQYEAGGGHVSAVFTDFDTSEDEEVAYRNLIDTASQIPVPSQGEMAVVFLGTSVWYDVDDVEAILFGSYSVDRNSGDIVRDGGLFDPKNELPDFQHIDAVVFSSIHFEEIDGGRRIAIRGCGVFERPGKLSEEQSGVLSFIRKAYARNTEIILQTRR